MHSPRRWRQRHALEKVAKHTPETELQEDGILYHDVLYTFLQPEDEKGIKQASKVASESFSQHEPMSLALGLSSHDLEPLFLSSLQDSAEQGFCLVARDPRTYHVVGVLISADMKDDSPPPEAPSLGPIFQMIEALETRLITHSHMEPFRKGDYLHQFVVSMRQDFAGRHHATFLYVLCEQLARDLKYKGLISEPTGAVSQHIKCAKMGFQKMHEIPYKEFLWQGKAVFKNIPSPSSCWITMKLLSEDE